MHVLYMANGAHRIGGRSFGFGLIYRKPLAVTTKPKEIDIKCHTHTHFYELIMAGGGGEVE